MHRGAALADEGEVPQVLDAGDILLGHGQQDFHFPLAGLEAAQALPAEGEPEDLREVARGDAVERRLFEPGADDDFAPGRFFATLDVGHALDAGEEVGGAFGVRGQRGGVFAVEVHPEEHAAPAGLPVVVLEQEADSRQLRQGGADLFLERGAFVVGDMFVAEGEHRLRFVLREVGIDRGDSQGFPQRPQGVLDPVHHLLGLLPVVEVGELVGEEDPVAVQAGEDRRREPQEEGEYGARQEGDGDSGGDPAAAEGEAEHPLVEVREALGPGRRHRSPSRQQARTDERDERQRDEERAEDGQRERQPDLAQPDGHLVLRADDRRQEDDRGGDRGGDDRPGNRVGPDDGGGLGAEAAPVFPNDGFEHHDGVVHQQTDAEHHPHHREDIQRPAGEVQDDRGGDDGHRDREAHDGGGVHPPQEEEEDEDREDRPEQSFGADPGQAGGDLRRLILEHQQVDPGERRVGGDLVLDEFGDRGRRFDGVRFGALEDAEPDGRFVVQVPPEADGRFAVGHLGDVGDPQTLLVQGETADLVDLFECSEAAHRGHAVRGADAAERQVAVQVPHALDDLAEVHPVGGDAVGAQVDPHFPRQDAAQFHARHPGDPPEGIGDAALEPFVAGGEVHSRSGDPRFHDGDLRGREGVHEDLAHIGRQRGPDILDRFVHLGARHIHGLAPGELELQAGAVGVRGGPDALRAGDGGERFLDRPHDLPLDLQRVRVRVGNGDEDRREVHLRQESQRYPAQTDGAQREHAQEQHRRGDRSVHRQPGEAHLSPRGSLRAPGIACGRTPSTRWGSRSG